MSNYNNGVEAQLNPLSRHPILSPPVSLLMDCLHLLKSFLCKIQVLYYFHIKTLLFITNLNTNVLIFPLVLHLTPF